MPPAETGWIKIPDSVVFLHFAVKPLRLLPALCESCTRRGTRSLYGGRPRARRLDRKATGTAGPTVPTTSMTDHPVDRVRGRKVVTIGTTPESSSMLQDPSLGLCSAVSAQTSGSSVTLISAIAAASALGDAELERVKTRLGPSQAPAIAHKQPNTEATPLAPTTDGPTSVGAGNSIDGGRPRARRLDRKATGTAGPTVPTTSTTDHPVDQVRGRTVVTIGTTPESSSMLQDPSLGLCSAQTSGPSNMLLSNKD